jgi:hypothetical protein
MPINPVSRLIITQEGGFIHLRNLSPSRLKELQMEILNLGGAEEENIPPRLKSRKKTKAKVAIGIGSLAAITGLGSTLAASISLNGGDPVEFGQGVAITAACNGEEDITFTPNSEYLADEGRFVLSSFTLSGINTSVTDQYTGIGCAGKVLIIRAYTDNSEFVDYTDGGDPYLTDPLYFSRERYTDQYGVETGADYKNSAIAIKISDDGTSFENVYSNFDGTDGTDDFWIWDSSVSYGTGSVEISFGGSTDSGLNSAAIDKFTVESVESINTDDDLADDGADWYASTYGG